MNILKSIWARLELTLEQHMDFNRGASDCECGLLPRSEQSEWYVKGFRQKEYRMDRDSRLDAWKRAHRQ